MKTLQTVLAEADNQKVAIRHFNISDLVADGIKFVPPPVDARVYRQEGLLNEEGDRGSPWRKI